MGKGKLAKFAEMEQNPLVVQCPFWVLKQDGFAMKGQWNSDFFHNDNPIVLELGCGRESIPSVLPAVTPKRTL